MKTIILRSMLLLCITASSALTVAQGKVTGSTAIPTSSEATVFVRPFCKFGLQFVVVTVMKESNHNGSGGVSVTQVTGKDGKPLLCEEDSK